jgi:hypothetical protein
MSRAFINTKKLFEYYDARDYGAVGDGIADDTAAVQAALNAVPFINNGGNPASSGAGRVRLPAGFYRITAPLEVRPGTHFVGEGQDASVLVADAALALPIIKLHRPGTIGSSFTRRYTVEDMQIRGVRTVGSIGISMQTIAEVQIERVYVFGMDVGIYMNDVIEPTITKCKISDCKSIGIQITDRCTTGTIAYSRLNSCREGPNVTIDGNGTLGWTILQCAIESAGADGATLPYNTTYLQAGHGLEIGARVVGEAPTGITLLGTYFESNYGDCVRIGSASNSAASKVYIAGGHWTPGVTSTPVRDDYKRGITCYGGELFLGGGIPGIETFPANRQLVMEAGASNTRPRLYNLNNVVPTGPFARNARQYDFSNNTFTAQQFQLADTLTLAGTYSQSATTTISISCTAHGLTNGQQIQLNFLSGSASDGFYTISNVTVNAFDVTASGSATTSGDVRIGGGLGLENRNTDVMARLYNKPFFINGEMRTAYQGTGLLSAGTLAVTFSTAAINADYVVLVTTEGTNLIRVGSRTTAGFTITSASGADASRVYWLVLHNG